VYMTSATFLNPAMKVTRLVVGNERIPVLVIDDLSLNYNELIACACKNVNHSSAFTASNGDLYPGVRKPSPANYSEQLKELLPILKSSFNFIDSNDMKVVFSAFSIATTPVTKLRPIQMLPHFDTPSVNQLAAVHFLCAKAYGGTSLYRHKASGFERITQQRLAPYRAMIKQQAIAQRLHERPSYISSDTTLFEQIASLEAKPNRLIVYPSNALHSGNINPDLGLSSNPSTGRLTISSFLAFG
jgi:hypothetical protein